MPTRPRIDLAGFHHVINRGVNRCDVFKHASDKDMFLQIINKTATIHKVSLHDYCLMDNHYHLLIETQTENLSTFMRIVSANYSQYFNKKYKRSGHLWQDRYKSKYIISDEYLYTLVRYIENNPIEAGMTDSIKNHPYTLASQILNANSLHPCMRESILLIDFDIQTLGEFLETPLSENELDYLKEKERQRIQKTNDGVKINKSKEFIEHFADIQNRNDRNFAIVNAHLDGYTQVEIAKHLNLSKSLVSKVVKSGDVASRV